MMYQGWTQDFKRGWGWGLCKYNSMHIEANEDNFGKNEDFMLKIFFQMVRVGLALLDPRLCMYIKMYMYTTHFQFLNF